MAKFSFYVGSDFFETSYEADLTGLGSLSERLRVGCPVGCNGLGKKFAEMATILSLFSSRSFLTNVSKNRKG